MKVYICGRMTGIPQMNFPRFDEVAADLRSRGFEVVSPAELDSPESRAAALAAEDGDLSGYSRETGETWGDLLARDCKLLADGGIEAIVVLEGWQQSKGARLETFVARLCGIPVVEYHAYSPMLAVRECEFYDVHGEIPEESGADYIEDPERPVSSVAEFTRLFGGQAPVAAGYDALAELTHSFNPKSETDGRVRKFDTGASRDTADGKFDFEGYLSPKVLWEFARYMTTNRQMPDGSLRDSDNWQKGIPLDVYMKSLLRHAIDLWLLHRGVSENRPEDGKPITLHDTLGGALFNLQGYWHESLKS